MPHEHGPGVMIHSHQWTPGRSSSWINSKDTSDFQFDAMALQSGRLRSMSRISAPIGVQKVALLWQSKAFKLGKAQLRVAFLQVSGFCIYSDALNSFLNSSVTNYWAVFHRTDIEAGTGFEQTTWHYAAKQCWVPTLLNSLYSFSKSKRLGPWASNSPVLSLKPSFGSTQLPGFLCYFGLFLSVEADMSMACFNWIRQT